MKAQRDEFGPDFWLRFAEWCRTHSRLLTTPGAAQLIEQRFDVSRATAYRWLAAWREVHPQAEVTEL
jgi:hypothetical protein